jgi:enoyl-CoA hydratase/carnithine racemase
VDRSCGPKVRSQVLERGAIACLFKEVGFGLIPGSGGVQHLTRLMGRGRALEVLLSAVDYDAEMAERYGWINRALPAAGLGDFVKSLAAISHTDRFCREPQGTPAL